MISTTNLAHELGVTRADVEALLDSLVRSDGAENVFAEGESEKWTSGLLIHDSAADRIRAHVGVGGRSSALREVADAAKRLAEAEAEKEDLESQWLAFRVRVNKANTRAEARQDILQEALWAAAKKGVPRDELAEAAGLTAEQIAEMLARSL